MSRLAMMSLAALLAFAAGPGCGEESQNYQAFKMVDGGLPAPARVEAPRAEGTGNLPLTGFRSTDAQAEQTEQRKVVREGQLGVVVPEAEAAIQTTARMAQQMGGYVERMTTSAILIRVPADVFDQAIGQVSQLGTVHQRRISAVDVSGQYTDLELRIENLRALAETYRKMLADAKAVQDALRIQRELAEVTGELERLEQQFRKLGSRIRYASLEVYFTSSPEAPAELRASLPFAWLSRLGVDELMSR
jgi:hypothetical protein